MVIKKIKTGKSYIFIFLCILSLCVFITVFIGDNSYFIVENQHKTLTIFQNDESEQLIKETHEEQWIENTNFDDSEGWDSSIEGDVNDVGTDIRDGEARFIVEGDSGSQIIIGLPDTSWNRISNDLNKTLPKTNDTIPQDSYEIRNGKGFWTSHHWGEHVWQLAQVQWEKEITTNVDMSQYYIISASLEAWCNATVYAKNGSSSISSDQLRPGGIDVPGDSGWYESGRKVQVGDYIKYYLKIVDINNLSKYEVSSFRTDTVKLGKNSAGIYDYLYDTKFEANEDNLRFYLGEALKKNSQRFKIILGIEFFCEDDDQYDRDTFKSVYFKNFTMSFSYLKKINANTLVSWKYSGDKIDAKGGSVKITNAKLYFEQKISEPWLSVAPSSEFQISINDEVFKETLKLSRSEKEFESAKKNGFDVTELIPEDDEIKVAIQILIGDEFALDRNIIVSIDEVELDITYDIYLSAEQSLLYQILFILACCGIGALFCYYIYYRAVLRYPKPIRKVRKYRKTLKKEKQPKIQILEREKAFTDSYKPKLANISSKSTIKSREEGLQTNSSFKSKKNKSKVNKKALLIIVFFFIGFLLFPMFLFLNPNNNQNQSYRNEDNQLSLSLAQDSFRWTLKSYEEQWIDNSEFENNEDWKLSLVGDLTDIDSNIDGNQANYFIKGMSGQFNATETINSQNWKRVKNPDNMSLPDTYQIISGAGCRVYHQWREDENQSVRVQWERNITMPVDMSDYEITSASLNIYVNGTVHATGDSTSGGIEVFGDNCDYINGGDYARYYTLISDINKTREYVAMEYYTYDNSLGKNSAGATDRLNNTKIEPNSEDDLIFYLDQALNYDNRNFTISLGINIRCEDNFGTDYDFWDALWIKNISLIINYAKIMNKLNVITWNYEGDEIDNEGGEVEIKNANVFFDYKIDKLWSFATKNAEIRVLINEQESGGTIKLKDAITVFEKASSDGFDVTDSVPEDEEINVAIQLLIVNDFGLTETYMISVDNVELEIEYDIILPGDQSLMFLIFFILACVAGGALITYIIYYQKVLKYPKPIRKVRKYRKNLYKKKQPEIKIISRESAFTDLFKLKSHEIEKFSKKQSSILQKEQDKLIETQIKKSAEDLTG